MRQGRDYPARCGQEGLGNISDHQAVSKWAAELGCCAPPYLYLECIEVFLTRGASVMPGVSVAPERPRRHKSQPSEVQQTYPSYRGSSPNE